MKVRLEYSQAAGTFDLLGSKTKSNAASIHKSLEDFIEPEKACRFMERMLMKYPQLSKTPFRNTFPSFDEIKKQYEEFLTEEKSDTQKQMALISEHREKVFAKLT